MPWYKTGTVSCTQNSTTVTGTNTAFAANSRVGDALLGPDGRWYEVANVASDTVLSILPAYMGANANGASYCIVPIQGYPKDLADQVRALVGKFGSLAAAPSINALAALTGVGGSVPCFTAADTMALLMVTTSQTDSILGRLSRVGDFGIGRQLDLRSTTYATGTPSDAFGKGETKGLANGGPSGLAIPGLADTSASLGTLVVNGHWGDVSGIGGISRVFITSTGIYRQAAVSASAWGPWNRVFDQSNVLGTVSQSNGVPTGAIIERGSNSNGEYVKFADGTMWCKGPISTSVTANGVSQYPYTLPAAFVNTDFFAAAFAQPQSSGDFYGAVYKVNQSTQRVDFGFRNGATAQSITGHYIAIGRWF